MIVSCLKDSVGKHIWQNNSNGTAINKTFWKTLNIRQTKSCPHKDSWEAVIITISTWSI